MTDICALQARWQQLMQQYEIPADLYLPVFKKLQKYYTEKHRYYHTLEHIAACLKAFDEVASHITYKHAFELALWFHDVIYQPFKINNEHKSAEYAAKELFQLGFSAQLINQVKQFILLTQHGAVIPVTPEEQLFIDIDLGILGASAKRYQQYENQIRQEYAKVPGFLFRKKRRQLLHDFLEQPTIFNSPYFYAQLEQQARNNLQTAIKQLF